MAQGTDAARDGRWQRQLVKRIVERMDAGATAVRERGAR
jgi:hypothetical protein